MIPYELSSLVLLRPALFVEEVKGSKKRNE